MLLGEATDVMVSVVLPCLNEEASVAACVEEALVALHTADLPGEVVVVDNGSTDQTVARAIDAGARVVAEPIPGYGSALRRGVAEARGQIVVMADADYTYDLSRIADVIKPIRLQEADLVIATRVPGKEDKTPWLHHHVGTPTLSWLNRRAAPGLSVRDSQSGYRAFRRDAVLALDLRGSGMEYASEMLVRAARSNFRIAEIPTAYRMRIGESKLNTLRDGLRHLRQIALLAPEVVLRLPAITVFVLGAVMEAYLLARPSGFEFGSLRWQPVFLATICMVLGSVGWVAAEAVEAISPLARRDARSRPTVWRRNLRRAAKTGAGTMIVGAALELALLLAGSSHDAITARRLAISGLAATLLLLGAVLIAAGLIGLLIEGQRSYVQPALSRDLTSNHG